MVTTHEDPEVITHDDLCSAVESSRELNTAEAAEVERGIWRTAQQGAVDGKLFWYEIEWSNQGDKKTGMFTYFRPVDLPLKPEEIAALMAEEKFSSGTEFELYCYTGQNAQRHIEEMDMYDSLLNYTEDGRVALTSLVIPIDQSLVSTPAYRLESLVSFWVQE